MSKQFDRGMKFWAKEFSLLKTYSFSEHPIFKISEYNLAFWGPFFTLDETGRRSPLHARFTSKPTVSRALNANVAEYKFRKAAVRVMGIKTVD